MRPILTITLNPAIDVSAETPTVVAGPKLRCTGQRINPGGGGVNVSRALRLMGYGSTAFVAMAGATGSLLCELLAQEGVPVVPFQVRGLTRQSFAVTARDSESQYRFVLDGPEWTPEEAAGMKALVKGLIPDGGLVVISGSMPPGLPPETLSDLKRQVNDAGGRVLLDTSREALKMAAEDGHHDAYHVLRVNGQEASELAGRDFSTPTELARFGHGLIDSGAAEQVVMSLGSRGTAGVTATDAFFCHSPQVDVVSAVGAGDSLMAALALGLADGEPFRNAVAQGVAAAAAAVMTPATELCEPATVAALLPRVKIDTLADL